MDIKSVTSMSVDKGTNTYSLHMPTGCPLGELYDALFEMLKRVVDESTIATQRAAPSQPAASTPEVASGS